MLKRQADCVYVWFSCCIALASEIEVTIMTSDDDDNEDNANDTPSRDDGQSGTTSFEYSPAPPLTIDPGSFDQSTSLLSSGLSTFR